MQKAGQAVKDAQTSDLLTLETEDTKATEWSEEREAAFLQPVA